jgi:hypothetical protein
MPQVRKSPLSGPGELQRHDDVTCVNCGHVCTADEAIAAGRLPGRVEMLDPE